MTRQVRTALDGNHDLLGLYLVIEPNALDGKYELFVDTPNRLANQPQKLMEQFRV
jgi:methyl-accepting chemotaxis protein